LSSSFTKALTNPPMVRRARIITV